MIAALLMALAQVVVVNPQTGQPIAIVYPSPPITINVPAPIVRPK